MPCKCIFRLWVPSHLPGPLGHGCSPSRGRVPQLESRSSLGVRAMAMLLQQVLAEEFFTVLRTQEQLGYVVYCRATYMGGTDALDFVVQSNRQPGFLVARIFSFLESMAVSLLGNGRWAVWARTLKPLRVAGR